MAYQLHQIRRALCRLGRTHPILWGNTDVQLVESSLEIRINIAESQGLELDLGCSVKERENLVVQRCRNGTGKPSHHQGHIEALPNKLLIGNDDLADLVRVCLKLIDQDQKALALFR